MLSIREALDRMMPAFIPRRTERVAIDQALGRHLSADVLTREDAPAFDNSAMDGWAVRAAELAGASAETPVSLPAVGESRAGGEGPPPHQPGSAMRIFTGAPLPKGADAVVVQEDAERRGDQVALYYAPKLHHHVRRRASDLRAGDVLLPLGHRVEPGSIALLASQGIGGVDVHRRPRVAILSTGDELRDLGDPPTPGTIVNSNAHMLAALVRLAGAEARIVPRAGDELEGIVERLESALDDDVVITTGGVSVGDYDIVKDAFAEAGVDMRFWKIAIKPGKPLAFGRRGDTPVIGLPGNPVSAFVTFHIFARPGLRRMLGDPAPFPAPIRVRLAEAYEHRPGRTELVRARLTHEGARLHPRQGSGAMASIAWADTLVVVPADVARLEAGAEVVALPLRTGTRADPPFGPADTP